MSENAWLSIMIVWIDPCAVPMTGGFSPVNANTALSGVLPSVRISLGDRCRISVLSSGSDALTSVGSGALIGLALIAVYRLSPRRVVGTEQNPAGLGPNVAAIAERCDVTLAKRHFAGAAA